MATNYKLHDFAKLLGKDVFVDANVLIYLFWPTGQHQYESNYAKVINDLIKQKKLSVCWFFSYFRGCQQSFKVWIPKIKFGSII